MGQGAYILAPLGPTLSTKEAAFFAEADPWGFILFARNVGTPDQLRRLTDDLRACVSRDAPILIDQEGGRVQRLQPPHWRSYIPPMDQAAGPDPDRAFWLRHRLIAQELRDVGVDVNCLPTCDLAQPDTHPILRNRCYGSDVETVVRLARAAVSGMAAGGVLPVMKHIPGHGRATVDSHLDLPRVDAPEKVLEAEDFAVFRALNDLPLGMTAHLVFEALSTRPATVDPAMIALIRDKIGFSGVLMTDDISMEALAGSVADRARASLAAGCDMILHCNGNLSEMEAIAEVSGAMTAPAQARADAALARRRAPEPIDIPALEAEFAALMQ